MKISRLITLHWGTLENREWEFRHTVLLTGEPGSGKAHLLDAAQALFTGAREGLCRFSTEQDGTAQPLAAEVATLAGHALGQLGPGLFLRRRSTTYVAAVFDASESAGETLSSFTVVAGLEAQEEQGRARLQKPPQFFIVRHALNRSHFLRDGVVSDAQAVVPVKDLYLHLLARLNIVTDGVQRYDNDLHYLQHLYGALIGKTYVTEGDALRAARALVKAMSHQQVGNVDDLVRHEILDAQDNTENLRNLRERMQALARLRTESDHLQTSIRRLRDIAAGSDEVLEVARRYVVDHIAHARRALTEAQDETRRASAAIEQQTQRNRVSEGRLQGLRDEQGDLEGRQHVIRAQLGESDVAREQKFLRDSLDLYQREFRTHWETLRSAARAAGSLLLRTSQLLEMDLPSVPALQRAAEPLHGPLRRLMQRWRGDLNTNLLADATAGNELPAFDLEDFDADLVAMDRMLRWDQHCVATAVVETLTEVGAKRRKIDEEYLELRTELRFLQSGKSPAPAEVHEAVSLLERELPGAEPRVLAELVEPKPGSRWQNAMEGYIGRNRFNIVVAPGFEAEAIRLVRKHFQDRAVQVVQGNKAIEDTQGLGLQATAALHELQCSHPVARAYLMAQYGRLRKVKSEEGLSRVSQGLMRDGTGSRGYGMFSCFEPDAGLVFGPAAQARRRAWCEQRLAQISTERRDLTQLATSLQHVSGSFSGLAVQALAPLVSRVLDVQLRYMAARRTLDMLDSSSIDGLDRQLAELGSALAQARRTYDTEMQELGKQNEELRQARERKQIHGRKVPGLEQEHSHALTWAARFAAVAGAVASERELLDEAQTLAQDDKVSLPVLKSRLDAAPGQLDSALRHLGSCVDTYLMAARSDEERFRFADPLSGLERLEDVLVPVLQVREDTARQLYRQEVLGLPGSTARLAEAQTQFNAMFTSGLCFKVRDEVRAGLYTLEKLNRELKNIPFGQDSYRLEWDWVPEFQKYFEFFEAVSEIVDTLERDHVLVFESQHLSEAHRATAARIKQLLLSEDRQAAEQALEDLADYRNYRRYDIARRNESGQVKLSTWGGGLSGELETPLYVIRAAVLAHALGHFGRDKTGAPALRLMLLDGALAGMDEARARSVLNFLSQQLRLQVVAAMPVARSAALKPEFAREFSFTKVLATRNGQALSVSEAQEKDLKQEALGRLWAEQAQVREPGQGGEVIGLGTRRQRQAPVEDDA